MNSNIGQNNRSGWLCFRNFLVGILLCFKVAVLASAPIISRNRWFKIALHIHLVIFFVVFTTVAESKVYTYPELPLKEMRIVAYTKAFAKRFGLPAPLLGTEPSGGLEAIEFALEKGPAWAPYYLCNFYLYLDSALPVKYPEEGVAGDVEMLNPATHFFGRSHKQWMKWPVLDRRRSTNLDGQYNRKANLASMDYIAFKQGVILGLSYKEFHREILPNLTYVKLQCPPPYLLIDNLRENIGIWLQKESKIDYRGRIHVDSGDFLKFPIPGNILQKIKEWGLKAKEANAVIQPIVTEKLKNESEIKQQ